MSACEHCGGIHLGQFDCPYKAVLCGLCGRSLLEHDNLCYCEPEATKVPEFDNNVLDALQQRYPTKLRDRIGQFMLDRGIKMGVNVDPGDVQDLIEQWENEQHPSKAFTPRTAHTWDPAKQEEIAPGKLNSAVSPYDDCLSPAHPGCKKCLVEPE